MHVRALRESAQAFFAEWLHLCTKLELGKPKLAAHPMQRIKANRPDDPGIRLLRVNRPKLHSLDAN